MTPLNCSSSTDTSLSSTNSIRDEFCKPTVLLPVVLRRPPTAEHFVLYDAVLDHVGSSVPVDLALGGAERRCGYRGGPN